jgi:hypothetical protein
MFIAVLVTISRIWNQPKCLSMDKLIKKMYVYTKDYSLVKKKKA